MAYVLGFIAADGSLEDATYLRGKYLRVCSNDLEIIDKIRSVMCSEHRVQKIKPKEFTFNNKIYVSKEKYLLRIGSHEIYDDLVRLGITPHKSKTIKFPSVPGSFISSFIRGYFDGDGCVSIYYKNKRLSATFTSGSKSFLEQLSDVISKALRKKRHEVFINNRAFQLKYSTKEAVLLLRKIYSAASEKLYLERKYNKFLEFLRLYPKWNYLLATYPSG